MADVEPFPFATVADLNDRWPDMPAGAEAHADVLLEDASQFILDVCPSASRASASTRKRVVCSVVRRAMQVDSDLIGVESWQESTGQFAGSYKSANPHGDLYLTRAERRSLGDGQQRAFGVDVASRAGASQHLPWCSLWFTGKWCSCGADIAGFPIYEVS